MTAYERKSNALEESRDTYTGSAHDSWFSEPVEPSGGWDLGSAIGSRDGSALLPWIDDLGESQAMPHADRIAASFGSHASKLEHVKSHVGGPAADATKALGAHAFAAGNHVAFGSQPDLHTAAHEAAHVVQQQAGIHLKGGIGRPGDDYERNADAVADRVVQGKSAHDLLAPFAADRSARTAAVQLRGDGDRASDQQAMLDEINRKWLDRQQHPGDYLNATAEDLEAIELRSGLKILRRFKGHDHYSADLASVAQSDPQLAREFIALVKDSGELPGPNMAAKPYVTRETTAEISANVSDNEGDKVEIMRLASNQLRALAPQIEKLRDDVQLLRRQADNASAKIANITHRQERERLQRELAERKESENRIIAAVERAGKLFVGIATGTEAIELVPELIEAVSFIEEQVNNGSYVPAQEDIDQMRAEDDNDEVRIARRELELIDQQVGSTKKTLRKLEFALEDIDKTLTHTRARAERGYDLQSRGKFRFAPLAAKEQQTLEYLHRATRFDWNCSNVLETVARLGDPAQLRWLQKRFPHDEAWGAAVRSHAASLREYPRHVERWRSAVQAFAESARASAQALSAQRATADNALIDGADRDSNRAIDQHEPVSHRGH